MFELGIYVKSKREELGVSYEELYERTRIRTLYLQSIEEGNYDILPGEVYLKGFLRTIARELELDYQHLIELYNADRKVLANDMDTEEEEISVPKKQGASSANSKLVWLIFGLIVIGSIVVFFLTQKTPGAIF